MSNEKLLINDIESNNPEVKSNNDCVCLKCYKLKCKSRNVENKYCPEQCGANTKG